MNGASRAVSASTLQWKSHGLISSLTGFLSAKFYNEHEL